MSMTWFAVLNQAEMRIFTREPGSHLELIKTISNPLVNLRGKELSRHKPGIRPKGGKGSRISAMNSGESPHQLMIADFAHKLGTFFNSHRKKNKFKELRIAAEPKFLGLIKSELDSETKKCVREWVRKDLQKEPMSQIQESFGMI